MRVIALLPLVALVVTSPASVGPAGAPAQARTVLPPADADRICARFIADFDRGRDRGYKYGRMAPPPMALPPPPPPPPPMAPPPPAAPVATEQSSNASVSARRAPQPGIVPPRPIVVIPGYIPDNPERYAGKEVATVQAVADAPVSTFSIDVDTGSYA